MTGERTMQAATFNCSLTCFSACQQAQWCAELPIEGVMQGAFTFAWVKAVVAHGGSTSQMKSSIEAHLADLKKRFRWLDQKPQVQMSKVVEQQDIVDTWTYQPSCPDCMTFLVGCAISHLDTWKHRTASEQVMEETGLTVCHTAHVSLRARLRSGEAFDEPLVVAPSRCEICGSAPHPSLAHASAGEIVQAYELLEVKETPLKTHWREVPLAQDLEGEPSMSSPLRICAALCAEEMDTFRSRKLTLELRVVADPLDLAQRSRFARACENGVSMATATSPCAEAIYPPWQLGPQLRFSWRLETRKVELMDQTPRRSQPRPRRPRSLHGIGGVGGGFGSGSTRPDRTLSVLDDGYEDDCQAPQPAPQPFQLLSNCLDAEAEMPTGLLLPLRRHQLQSLAWMQACEARSEPLLLGASREFLPAVQPPHAAQQILVEAGNQVAVAVFVFSKFSAHRKALGCRGVARVQRAFQPKGGLLADHVGSGKTAVTLALVASDRGTAKRSLVMMPGRLLQQWQQEVTKFLEPNLLDVQLWDGGDISDPEDFSRPSLLLAPIELLSPKRRELNKDGNNTRRAANVLSAAL
eukprot:symbB.v1.2.020259.t1/scaffold1696.1/size105557/1